MSSDPPPRLREISELAARLRSQRSVQKPQPSPTPQPDTLIKRIEHLERENAELKLKYNKALQLLSQYKTQTELRLNRAADRGDVSPLYDDSPVPGDSKKQLVRRYLEVHRSSDKTTSDPVLDLAETLNSRDHIFHPDNEDVPIEEISLLLKNNLKNSIPSLPIGRSSSDRWP